MEVLEYPLWGLIRFYLHGDAGIQYVLDSVITNHRGTVEDGTADDGAASEMRLVVPDS